MLGWLRGQAWVLDSNPGLLPKDKSDVALVMEKLGEIRLPLQSRDDMAAELQVWPELQCKPRCRVVDISPLCRV